MSDAIGLGKECWDLKEGYDGFGKLEGWDGLIISEGCNV